MRTDYITKLRCSTKILCSSPHEKEAVMRVLKEAGEQVSSVTDPKDMTCRYLGFESGREHWCGWVTLCRGFELKASEFLLNIWAESKRTVSVVLNSGYKAEYTEGDDFVSVGCQQIKVAKLRALLKEIDKVS